MFKIILVTFALVGLSMASPLLIRYRSDTTCKDFTVDQCNTPEDNDGIIEIIPVKSVQKCQDLCKFVYKEICTFFAYDFRQEECQLWKTTIPDYMNGCKKIAGPISPVFDDCDDYEELDDPCDVSDPK